MSNNPRLKKQIKAFHTYSYDSRNRLTAIDNNVTYQYNYDNKRVSKTVNGVKTYFIYDGHKLIGEYKLNLSDNSCQEYVYLNSTPIATITPKETYRVYSDHLDTSRRVASNNEEAKILWKWESKPFGESKATGDINFNLRFPRQYFDAETSTHYNINRDYNPVTGRYIQSDPIGVNGGVNGFGYVNEQPLIKIDEEGLKWSFWKLVNYYQSKNAMNIPEKGGILAQNFRNWEGNNAYTCAVRLSNAFNRAGYSNVTYRAWRYTSYSTLGDKYGKRYLYRAKEMGKHLGLFNRKYRIYSLSDLKYKNGLIYFENYHVDIIYSGGNGTPYMLGNYWATISSYLNHGRTYFMKL